MSGSESDYKAVSLLVSGGVNGVPFDHSHLLLLSTLQSGLLLLIDTVFSSVRKDYSTEFSALFESNNTSETYRDGLVFLSCIIGSVFFVWTVVLITLKCKGDIAGCASGANFRPGVSGEKREIPVGYTESNNTETSPDHDLGLDETYLQSPLPSDAAGSTSDSITEGSIGKGSVDSSVLLLPSNRERRTQVVFLMSAILTLLCVPLAHVLFFLPLRESSSQTSIYVIEARDIVKQVQVSANGVATGLANSLNILKDLPLSETEICPTGDPVVIEGLLGFDIASMISVYKRDYSGVEEAIANTTKDVDTFVEYMDEALTVAETSTDTAEVYLWLVPGVMLSTVFATVAISVGAIFSWRRQSSQRTQYILSFLVLPFLMLISLACWAIAIASAMGSAVAADGCTSGYANGSPALTIQNIMSTEGVEVTSHLAQMIQTYTMSCSGIDPTEVVYSHGMNATAITETIWEYLIVVDSIGRDKLSAMCGGDNDIDVFLQRFQELAQQLEAVSRSLESVSLSLSCPRINKLYDEAVNQSLCTQSADSLAYGFILFLTMGVTTMILITLRASWGQVIAEDKIYEEHEVAENMIVDEHEEYLLYISRYKHEWEDHDESNWRSQNPISPCFNSMDSQSEPSSSTQSESDPSSNSDQNEKQDKSIRVSSHAGGFNRYEADCRSVSSRDSGKISFLSLTESPRNEELNESSMSEARNPIDEKADNDERDGEEGIVSSTGESMELRLPPARYMGRQRPRHEPERDMYIESTPGLVKFVLEVDDPSPSIVQERVDQLTKPHLNRPLTPPRVRNQKMKERASFFESSPANDGYYEC